MPKHIEGITEQMYKAIQLLVWSDKGKSEIAEEIGVARETIWRWYKRDDFMDELQKERRNKFHVAGDVAQKELLKLIKDDSDKRTQLQAIKLVLGENNMCTDKSQIDLKTTQNIKVSFIKDNEEE
ncbi:phBC6A51 family helix-turn-helix protein [Cellulosilyticum sp. I15G10I2]|uniref:phBC6A51 family helix-turn-helix protein n=1 Tax=Cellulosilyticum sp. I15G10I2 TaxID=1892843 RepID=UPI00085C00ED|nr:phBC6A51 family helix-turn-helix protein [Cellulosilyticum sp. I15G10I2]